MGTGPRLRSAATLKKSNTSTAKLIRGKHGSGSSVRAFANKVDRQSNQLAFDITRKIERDIISADLPQGTLFGTYRELRARYQVGRQAIREAARVVELRGFARVRAGRNGGLVVTDRLGNLVARMVGGRLALLRKTEAESREARLLVSVAAVQFAAGRIGAGEILHQWLEAKPLTSEGNNKIGCTVLGFPVAIAEVSGNLAADLLARAIAASLGRRDGWETVMILNETMAKRSREMEFAIVKAISNQDVPLAVRLVRLYHRTFDGLAVPVEWQRVHVQSGNVMERTRAGHVARNVLGRLLSDRRNAGEATPNEERFLGSIRDLCVANGVCRATGVQALRILEASGVIVIRPGRNQGVFLKPPDARFVEEWLRNYLVEHGADSTATAQFRRLFLEEAASLIAAERKPKAPISKTSPAPAPVIEDLQFLRLPKLLAERNLIVRTIETVLRSLNSNPDVKH